MTPPSGPHRAASGHPPAAGVLAHEGGSHDDLGAEHVDPAGPGVDGVEARPRTGSGWSSASTDSRAMRSASAARCTGAAPRCPLSRGAALTLSMRSVTSTSVSGGMRCATSPSRLRRRPGDGEGDDRTEERVLARADDARDAGDGHALHDEPVGSQGPEPLGQGRVGVADGLGVDEVAAHPDEAGLVAHDRRGRLEDDGVGQAPRRRPRRRRRPRPPRRARRVCRRPRAGSRASSRVSARPSGLPAR